MSWMGGSGSFESRAKRTFGAQRGGAADTSPTSSDAQHALHGFSDRYRWQIRFPPFQNTFTCSAKD